MRAFATAVLLAASAAVFAQQTSQPQAPANRPDRSQPSPATRNPSKDQQGQQTFTGCLTAANNLYTLTVADPPVPGATAQNTAFTLKPSGNVDFKSHVNKKVEVKGTASAAQDAARVAERSSTQATGTSGANTNPGRNTGTVTPRVETSAKAEIVAQTLTVSSIREVSSKCDPLAK